MTHPDTNLKITQSENGTMINTPNVLVIETSELNIVTNMAAEWKFTLFPQEAKAPYIIGDTESRNHVLVHERAFTVGADYVQLPPPSDYDAKITVNVSALTMKTKKHSTDLDDAFDRANSILKRFDEKLEDINAKTVYRQPFDRITPPSVVVGITLNHGNLNSAAVESDTINGSAENISIVVNSSTIDAGALGDINISNDLLIKGRDGSTFNAAAVDDIRIDGGLKIGYDDAAYTLFSTHDMKVAARRAALTSLTMNATSVHIEGDEALTIKAKNTNIISDNITITARPGCDTHDYLGIVSFNVESELKLNATALNIEATCGSIEFESARSINLVAPTFCFDSNSITIDALGDLDFTNTNLVNMDQNPTFRVTSVTHKYHGYEINSVAPVNTTLTRNHVSNDKAFHVVSTEGWQQALAKSTRLETELWMRIRTVTSDELLRVSSITSYGEHPTINTHTGAVNSHAMDADVTAVDSTGAAYVFDGALTFKSGEIVINSTNLNINSTVVSFTGDSINHESTNLVIKGEFTAKTTNGKGGWGVSTIGCSAALTFVDDVSFGPATPTWTASNNLYRHGKNLLHFQSTVACKDQILYKNGDYAAAGGEYLRMCDIFTDRALGSNAQHLADELRDHALRSDASFVITTEVVGGVTRYSAADLAKMKGDFLSLTETSGVEWALVGGGYNQSYATVADLIGLALNVIEAGGDTRLEQDPLLLPLHIIPFVTEYGRKWSVLKLYIPGSVVDYKRVNIGGIEAPEEDLYNGRWSGVSDLLDHHDIIEIKTSDNIYVGSSDTPNIENTDWDVNTLITHSESVFSDKRLKRDIQSTEGESLLRKVKRLEGVIYNWKDSDDNTDISGFIAQDALLVFPEIVNTDNSAQLSVDYNQVLTVIPFLCRKIKRLEHKINSL